MENREVAEIDWEGIFREQNVEKYGRDLYDKFFDIVTNAIDSELEECIVFDGGIMDPFICILYENDYVYVLNQCMEFYIELEEYELCAIIRDKLKLL